MSKRSYLLVPLALAGTLLWAPASAAAPTASPCEETETVRIWASPRAPGVGEELEILAVAVDRGLSDLAAFDPVGNGLPLRTRAYGGPPWSLTATIANAKGGTYRIEARQGGRVVSCREIAVGRAARQSAAGGDFPLGQWDLAAEALYAAWIERLFDAPPEQSLSFSSLQPVLRDPQRNFLFDRLNRGEDERLPATPDCADLPYFLRAYFAWKMGLPIAFRPCGRGSAKGPPRCGEPVIEEGFTRTPAPVSSFVSVSRKLMDTVHSGSARTALRDEGTDFYPIPLDRGAIWPGTLFADPYGHVLVVVKWVPQTGAHAGLLLAVDAQPDNSVGRKRFWEGNFLFASDLPSAGPGFKTFRPLVRAGGFGGALRQASNAALRSGAGFAPYSDEQSGLAVDDFYARVDRLINPDGLDPQGAYEAMLAALVEQLETRVTSVDNGEGYLRKNPGAVVAMPSGVAIFETTGPWEDYATPSRDMRLLIALKVLDALPGRILRYPEIFVLAGEAPARAAVRIEQLHARRLKERHIAYTRSDGSPWRLSLAEIYERRPALEMAYNPNDCVELRWGAALGTPEAVPCRRQAPAEQRARMEEYRRWFREARRPPR